MNVHFSAICVAFLIHFACFSQGPAKPPPKWKAAAPLEQLIGLSRLDLPHNSPEAIRQELLDTNTIHLIAKSIGLSDRDLATVQVAQKPGYDWVWLYQVGRSEKAFQALSEQLRNYIQAREDGHTKAFLLAAITNRVNPATIGDPDLRALASSRKLLPISWLKKESSGTTTNKAGRIVSRTITTTVVNGKTVTNETAQVPMVDEICRWVLYTLTDGEIAWRYFVKFKPDGSLDRVDESKCDAKEYDPKYRQLIKEVEEEVEAEMKREGTYRQFGSVHRLWRLKKEKLKARGIEWRSPPELNRNVTFD